MKFLAAMALLPTLVATALGGTPESHPVMVLTDSGIIVCSLTVLVDGQGPKERFESFVDTFLKSLDKNNDGTVTVDEAQARILTAREAAQFQLVRTDVPAADSPVDVNPKDGKITRAELLAHFRRIGLLPFWLKFQPRLPDTDPNGDAMAARANDASLFDRLDTNSDKKLSVEELTKALDVLRKLDLDNDETISLAELQPLPNQRAVPRQAMNNAAVLPVPFVSPASGESMPKLIRRIIEKYDSADAAKTGVPSLAAKNQKLSRLEIGLSTAEFDRYDVDGDGQLDFAELRQFVSAPDPTIELTVDLKAGKIEATGTSAGKVRMTADGAAHFQMGSAQLSLSAIPPAANVDPELLVAPLFMALDADANGYLEKSEAPENALSGASFAELDVDKNGKVYLEEVVTYMRSRLDTARSRIECDAREQGRTLFDILDADRDGRLAHREVRSVADKLSLWDADGDGQLSESEIPLQFQLIVTQGSIPNLALPQNPAMAQRNANGARIDGPVWFRRMDRNSDGEISRREFLGDLDLFTRLDLNSDGAIELSEALQARRDK
jgi:Ca2+-binding EF-hand superfamily protein